LIHFPPVYTESILL